MSAVVRILAGAALVASLAGVAGLAACKGKKAEPSPAAVYEKLDKMAHEEGGEALQTWQQRPREQCVKDFEEGRAKLGDERWQEFVTCIDSKTSFSAAYSECEQFRPPQ
jgi:hypothetical protein